jgi:IclR family pca regulon transcriptional regulator
MYGETFNMAILDGTDILYIDRVKTQSILTINLEIGSKLPAYCTSMGRVLLAHLPPAEARCRILESRREVYTPRTLVDAEAIMTVLEQVRKEGYAVNGGELAQELWSAAAPIRNRGGAVVAALNMAVNAAQHEPAYIQSVMVPAVQETAERISEAMGYETHQNADA